jgi:hypothetical protein
VGRSVRHACQAAALAGNAGLRRQNLILGRFAPTDSLAASNSYNGFSAVVEAETPAGPIRPAPFSKLRGRRSSIFAFEIKTNGKVPSNRGNKHGSIFAFSSGSDQKCLRCFLPRETGQAQARGGNRGSGMTEYHFDRFGHYLGYLDAMGRYFDARGTLRGRIDARGDLADENGVCCGYVDRQGNVYDENGLWRGYLQRSRRAASPSIECGVTKAAGAALSARL